MMTLAPPNSPSSNGSILSRVSPAVMSRCSTFLIRGSARMRRVISIALAMLMAGCAAVRPQQTSAVIAPAAHQTDVTPPKADLLKLADWPWPQIDLSRLNPDRQPSNDRDWIDEQNVLAYAATDGDQVRVHNVRNAQFFTYRDCVV